MTDVYKEKVKAAHDMVSALCRPRGSAGSREWIMSIPARPDYDPDLVIRGGLRAAETDIAALEAERDELQRRLDAICNWIDTNNDNGAGEAIYAIAEGRHNE